MIFITYKLRLCAPFIFLFSLRTNPKTRKIDHVCRINNMQLNLPLSEMTRVEKLIVIDQIWDDLIKNLDEVPSPDWPKDILSARETRVKNDESVFKVWGKSKSILRDEFK